MSVYVQDPDFTLYVGDVRDVLATLADESVDCCVTSPPYWGLRDYGTATWDGGDATCDHIAPLAGGTKKSTIGTAHWANGLTEEALTDQVSRRSFFRDTCGKCGAVRVDKQLGLERTPDEYVAAMVDVFAQVRRVMKPQGTLWLNLGDSYAGSGKGPSNEDSKQRTNTGSLIPGRRNPQQFAGGQAPTDWLPVPKGIKAKDLVGIPWRVAFALQADGWYLRSDIIWTKPNPMPESITDRPTKAHEYVFLFSKRARYFYDQDAIAEPVASSSIERAHLGKRPVSSRHQEMQKRGIHGASDTLRVYDRPTRNARTVWEIATQPYAEAHFAVFPEDLPRRCILAGCPKGGVVLDPFMGSGTTAHVARGLGRKSVGIELNPEYAGLCAKRLSQLSLLTP